MEQIEQQDLKQGTTYDIHCTRKGNFQGTLLTNSIDGEFAKFKITSGKARFMSAEDRGEGETVTVRFSFCKFFPIAPPEGGEA